MKGVPLERGEGARRPARGAFTLLEVMIAMAIFCMAVFVILESTSQGLRAARSLQLNQPDVAMVVAELMLTNRLADSAIEGDLGDFYPGFTYRIEPPEEIFTNGFYQVDITILGPGVSAPYESKTSLYLWRPDSQRLNSGMRR